MLKKMTEKQEFWLYGLHTVHSALLNQQRKKIKLLITKHSLENLNLLLKGKKVSDFCNVTIVEKNKIFHALGQDVTHQGLAMQVRPLNYENDLKSFIKKQNPVLLVVLENITDPQNVGAIFRSCLSFGVDGIITTIRHAAKESGGMAKAASGALDAVPLIRIHNLHNAIQILKDNDFWLSGFDAQSIQNIEKMTTTKKHVLIFGSEGEGIRQITKKNCDFLFRIPISKKIDSLNVSNSVAVALYHYKNLIPQ